MATFETDRIFRLPSEAAHVPPDSARTIAPVTALVPTLEAKSRAIAWPYAFVAAAAVFAVVVGSLLERGPGPSPTRKPVAMMLSQRGATSGSKFVSGRLVTLKWTEIPHASDYQLQVATAPGDPSDAVVFGGESNTISIRATQYHLLVTGQQFYYWRVKALVASHWLPYTRSRHFAVAKPRIDQPVAMAPVTGIGRGGKHARLCWTPVKNAVAYRVRIYGQRTRTVRGTCVTLSVQPRTYRWSVAALVKGVGTYTGAYSVAVELYVHATHRTSTAVRMHGYHGAVRHTTKQRATKSTHRAVARVPASTGSVEVAFGAPSRPTARANVGSTRSLSTLGRTTRRFSRSTTATRTRVTSHSPTWVKPSRSTSIPSRRTVRTTRTTVASSRKSKAPATPIKRHVPVTTTRLPAPPPPPTVPTRGVAATAPVPTRGVTTAGSTTSSAAVYIRPAVAPKVVAISPAPTTFSVPIIRASSPAPASSKAPTPAPTSVTTNLRQRPAHPTHPDHPVHPAHPVHP